MECGRQPHSRLSAVRYAAILFVFLAMVMQMAVSDLRATAMAMDATDASMQVTVPPCAGMCGSALMHVCLPASRVCAAIVGTFTHAPLFVPLVLLFIALTAALVVQWGVIRRAVLWLWPPDEHRALLQVFLI